MKLKPFIYLFIYSTISVFLRIFLFLLLPPKPKALLPHLQMWNMCNLVKNDCDILDWGDIWILSIDSNIAKSRLGACISKRKRQCIAHWQGSYQQMGQFIVVFDDKKGWTISQLSYFHRAMQSKFAENLSLISHLNFRMSDIVGGKIVKDNEVEMNEVLPSRIHGSTLKSLYCCQ